MRHPNIVALYGMTHNPNTDQLFIVQEFVGGGNLHDLSRDPNKFTVDKFVSITIELFGKCSPFPENISKVLFEK
jgi:serine/threonine protein kinase